MRWHQVSVSWDPPGKRMCHFYTDLCKVEISSLFYSDFTFFFLSDTSSAGLGSLFLLLLIGNLTQQKWVNPQSWDWGQKWPFLNPEMLVLVVYSAPSACQGEMKIARSHSFGSKKHFHTWELGLFNADLFTCILLCLKRPFLLRQGRIILCLKSGDALLQKSLSFSPHVREFNPLKATITQKIHAQGNTQSRVVVIRKQIQMSCSRGVQTFIWFSEESYECFTCLTLIR